MQYIELFRRYIRYHESTTNFFDKRKSVTIKAYYNKYGVVTEFLFEQKLLKLQAVDFTVSLSRDLLTWLNAKYSYNYSVRIVEICRAVLHYGASHEFIKYNPLSPLRLPKAAPAKPVYLTPEEISWISEMEPITTMIEKAKDMFLFQCWTGLDYGDLISVGRDHIVEYKERLYIVKDRNKTGVDASIPYTDKAAAIFEKHNYNMRLLSNPKYNAALKDIAIDAGIDKHLTTHIGRKTYAMIMLNYENYSMEAVSKMVGHKTVKTTENFYAQVNIERVSREVDDKEAI